MASIDFVAHETVVPATWLNEVDRTQHDILGNPSDAADIRTAISVDSSAEVTAKDDAILADLASTDPGKGASLLGLESGGVVQDIQSDDPESLIVTIPRALATAPQTITVSVGSGEDFPTINDAVEYLSRFRPTHKTPLVTGIINLASGFVMQEQVLVHGIDLGWITITSEDAEVSIDASALTESPSTGVLSYGDTQRPAFGVYRGGMLPRIGALFDLGMTGSPDSTNHRVGVLAYGAGSRVEVLPACGVRRAGWYGILIGFGGRGFARGANFSGSCGRGAFCNEGGDLSAYQINASGAGTTGVHVSEGGTLSAEGANLSGCGSYAASANNTGRVHVQDADCSGAGEAALHAENASYINARGADCTDCAGVAIQCISGSVINCPDAIASGAAVRGIQCTQTGRVNAKNVNAQKGVSPDSTDVEVLEGGQVNFTGGTGGTSVIINTLSSAGVIYAS